MKKHFVSLLSKTHRFIIQRFESKIKDCYILVSYEQSIPIVVFHCFSTIGECMLPNILNMHLHFPCISIKRLCHFRKRIFPTDEMPLQISQSHFSNRRNAFVKFAKPFSSHFYYSVAFLREHQKIVSSIGRLSILFENTNFAPFRLYHPRMP